ncbi:MAG TPA: acido-empty-quinoprotein group A [Bryobacteraceae bacterium]|jgi:alcohol dehydrogenase (cytochrome c)|nr:acido-empty-quinoprotein group A [Bryobacteraceae bacterium]
MINRGRLPLIPLLACLALPAAAQNLDPASIAKPLSDSWPTYSGDYSGMRYSSLTQVNQSNVKHLTLAWVSKITAGLGRSAPARGFGGGAPAVPTIVGGEGTGDLNEVGGRSSRIVGAVLEVDGFLYVSTPDNAWAIDARNGQLQWHYVWKTKGGTHTGNRGMAMWHGYLYFETPDDFLVSLDARTGKERWHKIIADFSEQYFSTPAPIVVGNHVLVGTGNDLDAPAPLQSFDPETGEVQWTWYATPQKKGDPGLESWANLDAAKHGGGPMWIPGSYDPETHLYILGTGNPTPAYTSGTRGEGANLYTCALVAVNVDTGKMAWYYQTSPHDTHDWDSTQTPILTDAEFRGQKRKLVMQATRNGYYFVLDRVTGEHLVTGKFSPAANWAKGVDAQGHPIRNPKKDFDVAGALVSPTNAGATNWMPPAFSPETGMFYVQSEDSYSMYYLTELDPRGSMGLGGKEERDAGTFGTYLTAIDYHTGEIAWRHHYSGSGAWGGTNVGHGVLTTAGKLMFTGDPSGNFVAYEPTKGTALWHAQLGEVSNSPETYMIDGKQYVLIGAVDSLYAFVLQD